MTEHRQLGVCRNPTFEDLIFRSNTCVSVPQPTHKDLSYFWIFAIFLTALVYVLRLCMGNSATNIYKKTTNYFCSPSDSASSDEFSDETSRRVVVLRERRSSLCRDEDNDIAHEFYEETKQKDGKTRMKRVFKTYPLGFVKLAVPCLHPDFTRVIMPNYDIMSQLNRTGDKEREGENKNS